jgi:hypothetical protein
METVREKRIGNLYFLPYWSVAACSFAIGYGLALPRYWESAVLAWALLSFFAWRAHPDLCLCASTLVAAAGLLFSVPGPLMVIGVSASLALWDLAMAGIPTSDEQAAKVALENYRRSRLPYLLLALGVGTSLALLGPALRLRLPFFVMLLCVIACAFGLDRLITRLRGRR